MRRLILFLASTLLRSKIANIMCVVSMISILITWAAMAHNIESKLYLLIFSVILSLATIVLFALLWLTKLIWQKSDLTLLILGGIMLLIAIGNSVQNLI